MEQAWTHIVEELTQQIGKKGEQQMDPPLCVCLITAFNTQITLLRSACLLLFCDFICGKSSVENTEFKCNIL